MTLKNLIFTDFQIIKTKLRPCQLGVFLRDKTEFKSVYLHYLIAHSDNILDFKLPINPAIRRKSVTSTDSERKTTKKYCNHFFLKR